MATSALNIVDGVNTVVLDMPAGVHYELAARVDWAVLGSTPALVGTALNARYAEALTALLADPQLGGLAMDVREGSSRADAGSLGLEVEIGREPFTATNGRLALHLTVPYWQPWAQPSKREAIHAALQAAVDLHTPGPGLCIRERALSTFHAALAASLSPIPVQRNSERPADVQSSLVVLVDGDQVADHGNLGVTGYTSFVTVEVYVDGASTLALDAVVQGVRSVIRGADRLGGLVDDVMEADVDPDVLREQYTGPMLAARIEAQILFSTAAGKPYELP